MDDRADHLSDTAGRRIGLEGFHAFSKAPLQVLNIRPDAVVALLRDRFRSGSRGLLRHGSTVL
jgi:hypothetical protein